MLSGEDRMNSFIANWKAGASRKPPYIFPGDEILLDTVHMDKYVVVLSGFKKFIQNGSFDKGKNSAMHVGLLPMPYVGNLNRASIFFGLNP